MRFVLCLRVHVRDAEGVLRSRLRASAEDCAIFNGHEIAGVPVLYTGSAVAMQLIFSLRGATKPLVAWLDSVGRGPVRGPPHKAAEGHRGGSAAAAGHRGGHRGHRWRRRIVLSHRLFRPVRLASLIG